MLPSIYYLCWLPYAEEKFWGKYAE